MSTSQPRCIKKENFCFYIIEQKICNSTVSAEDILMQLYPYLDSVLDTDILSELVDGFCSLIVQDRLNDEKIMAKLVRMFVSDCVDAKIIQILGVFFETLIRLGRQKRLILSLSLDAITENKLRTFLNVIQSTQD